MTERKLVEVREDGKEIYEYPDGSKRDAKGYFVERPPYAAPVITQDNASELAEIRWQKVQEHFEAGTMNAKDVSGSVAKSPMQVVERIANAQTTLSLDTEKGYASTKAAEFVFRAAGWSRPKETQHVTAIQVNISREVGDYVDGIVASDNDTAGDG
jgi:hypothetical protein